MDEGDRSNINLREGLMDHENNKHRRRRRDVSYVWPSRSEFAYGRHKLYEMVDDESTDLIVSWSKSGKSFIIWKETEFCKDVLPKFLGYNKMSLFRYEVNNMGFKKISSEDEPGKYAKDDFFRGKVETPLTSDETFARIKEMADELRRRGSFII